MAPKRLTLASLGGGELELLVERELKKLCENIVDPNVKTEAVRKLTVVLSVKPDKKGQVADITYSVKSSLPGPDCSKTTAYIAMQPGTSEIALFGVDIRQADLFKKPEDSVITTIHPVSSPTAAAPKPDAKTMAAEGRVASS